MKKRTVMVPSSRSISKDYNNKSNNRNLQNRKYLHHQQHHHRHPENTGAKRLTALQSGFLYHELKSETIQKYYTSSKADQGINNRDEDEPHHIFLRRSCRLSSKKKHQQEQQQQQQQPLFFQSASSYYHDLIHVKQESKSIFKEINEKFNFKTNNNGLPSLTDTLIGCNNNLLLQTNINNPPKAKQFYQDRVTHEIRLLNESMSSSSASKRQATERSKQQLQETDEMNKENIPVKSFPHVPQCNWVFQTPPNRKLKSASETNQQQQINNNRIQPAVLDANKVIYEMKNRVNIDLSHFSNKQEVNIDKRYMMEVSTNRSSPFRDLNQGADELENHFLSLTCRPKKTTTVQSKVAAAANGVALKRKRDIFEPEFEEENECESLDEFDAKFPLINNENHLTQAEESFTFQFTTDDDEDVEGCNSKTATTTTTTTTGHFFDFAGNKKDSFHFQF